MAERRRRITERNEEKGWRKEGVSKGRGGINTDSDGSLGREATDSQKWFGSFAYGRTTGRYISG